MAREILWREALLMTSMTEVLELLGWRPQRIEPAGPRGKCPIHISGSVESRSFHHDGMIFHCETCKAWGNWIQLVEHVHQLSPRRAVQWVFSRLGLRVPRGDSMPRMLPSRRKPRGTGRGDTGGAGGTPAS